MPIAGVLVAPELVYIALAALAVALWWTSTHLIDSGDQGIEFISAVRDGAHDLVERLIGWLRSWLWDVGGSIVDWAHSIVDWLFQWPLRAVEIVRNWGGTLRSWSDDLLILRDRLRSAIQGIVDWIVAAHNAITVDLPSWITGQLATIADWVDTRLGDLGSWVTGEIASVRDWVDARFWDFRSWFTGEIASVRDWVDALVQEARDFAQALVDQLRSDLWAWIASWQPLLEWLRSIWPTLNDFLTNPWAWLFARAGRLLWPLVEDWLARVWDGDA